jgi:hypothetical protein
MIVSNRGLDSNARKARADDALAEEFELLDEILQARTATGLPQGLVAARIGGYSSKRSTGPRAKIARAGECDC